MSPRHAVAVCVLALIALVPTIIHSYVGMVIDDGRKTAGVPVMLAGYRSTPSDRGPTWGKRRFESDDWIERNYTNTSTGDDVVLTIIRSYDLKTLYHHPELAVAYRERHTYEPERTRLFPGRDTVPVHLLQAVEPDRAAAMYVLEYENTFVEHPILFQLRTSGELLFGGRKAMTLFFVQDASAPSDSGLPTAGMTNILFAAIDAFTSQRQQVVTRTFALP
jgi:hypothetical protein